MIVPVGEDAPAPGQRPEELPSPHRAHSTSQWRLAARHRQRREAAGRLSCFPGGIRLQSGQLPAPAARGSGVPGSGALDQHLRQAGSRERSQLPAVLSGSSTHRRCPAIRRDRSESNLRRSRSETVERLCGSRLPARQGTDTQAGDREALWLLDPERVVGPVEPEYVGAVMAHAQAKAVASGLTPTLPQVVGGLELVPEPAGPVLAEGRSG